jgi:hypothetical protein
MPIPSKGYLEWKSDNTGASGNYFVDVEVASNDRLVFIDESKRGVREKVIMRRNSETGKMETIAADGWTEYRGLIQENSPFVMSGHYYVGDRAGGFTDRGVFTLRYEAPRDE